MLDRRQFLTHSIGAGTLLAQAQPASGTQPNILHIMSDQQQWATIANRSPC